VGAALGRVGPGHPRVGPPLFPWNAALRSGDFWGYISIHPASAAYHPAPTAIHPGPKKRREPLLNQKRVSPCLAEPP